MRGVACACLLFPFLSSFLARVVLCCIFAFLSSQLGGVRCVGSMLFVSVAAVVQGRFCFGLLWSQETTDRKKRERERESVCVCVYVCVTGRQTDTHAHAQRIRLVSWKRGVDGARPRVQATNHILHAHVPLLVSFITGLDILLAAICHLPFHKRLKRRSSELRVIATATQRNDG